MNATGLIDRLDDLINPIVVKELRQAVKSRLVVAVLMLFLGVQVFVIGARVIYDDASLTDAMAGRVGHELFLVIQGILLGTCMILIPAYACIRLAAERSDHNVDLLFISTLKPRSIIAGKFFSALVLAMLVYSACAPFMTFTYLLRGIDMPSILLAMVIDLLAMVFSTQLALFLASLAVPRVLKFVFAAGGFLWLVGVYTSLLGAVSELLDRGVRDWEMFWVGFGLMSLAVLGATGLLFFWSIALISPPSTNRATASRLWLVGMWLVLGAAIPAYLFWPTSSSRAVWAERAPILLWLIGSVVLFCVQLAISINERDSWGYRVARTIPRRVIFRLPAFLFYSGAAGGVVLAVFCLAVTLLTGVIWAYYAASLPGAGVVPAFDVGNPFFEVVRFLAALALFTYCYGMSAVLVRTYLLGDRNLPSSYTWVIALVMIGVGSSVPLMAAYIIHMDDFSGQSYTMPWWSLTNPFSALYDLGPGDRYYRGADVPFDGVLFAFLSTWAFVVSLLALPWFVGQVSRFHPPAKRPRRRRAEEEVEVELLPPVAPPKDDDLLDKLIDAQGVTEADVLDAHGIEGNGKESGPDKDRGKVQVIPPGEAE